MHIQTKICILKKFHKKLLSLDILEKIMRIKTFALTIFLASLISVGFYPKIKNFYNQKKIERNFNQLSSQEKEYISNFFQYLVRVSGFGYVLFGDKPMSIEFIDYSRPYLSVDSFNYMDDYHITGKYRFNEGWETWKKYDHLFPSSNFIFIEYPHKEISNFLEICLINKSLFIKAVEKNLTDFQKVLGSNLSPEEILNAYIAKGKEFKIIYEHDGLFGTLLGYGRNNAWAYMDEANRPLLMSFIIEICKDNLEETYMNLPGFSALPGTKESIDLTNKYTKQRVEIEKLIQESGFALPVLKKLVFD